MHPREVANHKALYGLCIDPQDGNRLASYAEVCECVCMYVCVCVCVCVSVGGCIHVCE